MSDVTGIEWTDATWNPVTGCTRVSPGCAHCYIERTPPFRMEGRRFSSGKDGGTTGVRLHPERLEQPLRWRKPRRVFVNSLSDLFHEGIPDEFIDGVFGVIAASERLGADARPGHVFQVLTKRPERMRDYLASDRRAGWATAAALYGGGVDPDGIHDAVAFGPLVPHNAWLGVSIENARFTWRADVLREIPAAVRFISAEPLLGSLFPETTPAGGHGQGGRWPLDLTGIDWVIVGGESGPGARPMHPDWARELRDACFDSAMPAGGLPHGEHPYDYGYERPAFFFKQWGEWAPPGGSDGIRPGDICMSADGDTYEVQRDYVCAHNESDGEWLRKVGKKRAGRLLDGREWNEMPPARSGSHSADSAVPQRMR